MNHNFTKTLTPEAKYLLADGSELVYCSGVSPDASDAYFAWLDALPILEEYARHTVGSSVFRTYRIRNGGILQVSYAGADCTLRITEDPLQGPFEGFLPQQVLSRPRVCDPMLVVLPLDYTHRDMSDGNGMGYAVLLEDGTWVIWDGGCPWDAEALFGYLYDRSPLPDHRVVISVWILTHSHYDHYSCFRAFTMLYADRAEVRYFLLNPIEKDETVIAAGAVDQFLTRDFPNLSERYAGAHAVRVRSGQTMALHGAKLEILQTFEDVLPRRMKYLNEASVVTRLHIAGQTLLFSADCECAACEPLQLLGDGLKSTFLQVPHHAFSGGSPAMWDAISPEWLLFSTNYDTLTRRLLPTWQGGLYTSLLTRPGIKGFYASDGAVKEILLPLENRNQIRFCIRPDAAEIEARMATSTSEDK